MTVQGGNTMCWGGGGGGEGGNVQCDAMHQQREQSSQSGPAVKPLAVACWYSAWGDERLGEIEPCVSASRSRRSTSGGGGLTLVGDPACELGRHRKV